MDDLRLNSHLLNVPPEVDLLKTDKTQRFKIIQKFGVGFDIGSSAIEDVWSIGGVYNWPTAGFNLEAISTSANDIAGGAGGRVLTVECLDFNTWLETNVNIDMNGTNPTTATSELFGRVNRAFLKESGVYATTTALSHQGDITIRTASAGQDHCELLMRHTNTVSLGQTLLGRYSVPANAKAYVQNINFHTENVKPITVYFFKRENADIFSAPFSAKQVIFPVVSIDGHHSTIFENPIKFDEKTDIWFAAIGDAGAANNISLNFEITLKYFDL